MSSIKLSKEHGVNPSILLCPVCKKDAGLALMGHLKGDMEAPKYQYDQNPCQDCKDEITGYGDLGFTFIILKDEAEHNKEREGFSPWPYYVGVSVLKYESELVKDVRKTYGEDSKCVYVIESEAKTIGVHPDDHETTKQEKKQ